MKSFFVSILFLMFTSTAFSGETQNCSELDNGDWRLTFDFDSGKVEFFDNNSTTTGTYAYTIEVVEGIDVFNSDDTTDPWQAKYFGNRLGKGNKAELILEDDVIQFVCLPKKN